MQKNTRRDFLRSAMIAGSACTSFALNKNVLEAKVAKRQISLGYDNFAVRAMGWKASELLDYAAKLKCDTLFITDFGPLEKLDDEKYLKNLAQYAVDKGV